MGVREPTSDRENSSPSHWVVRSSHIALDAVDDSEGVTARDIADAL